jgi:hypothetical protein
MIGSSLVNVSAEAAHSSLTYVKAHSLTWPNRIKRSLGASSYVKSGRKDFAERGGWMKIKLRVSKHGSPLHAETYDVADADSFGKACADAWSKSIQEQLRKDTSIGAVMEHIESEMLDRLIGLQIAVERPQ